MHPEAPLDPTPPRDRLGVLDVLRGVALFGILAVNLSYWFRTHPMVFLVHPDRWQGAADQGVDLLLMLLFNGRFLTLFSMLFGVGLALQRERVVAAGGRFYPLAARRLAVLFLIGVAHLVLLWMGDVLHLYALFGPLLLFLLARTTRTLAICTGLLVALPVLMSVWHLVTASGGAPSAPPDMEVYRQQALEALRVYGHGGFVEVTRYRITDYIQQIPTLALIAHAVPLSFLVGVLVWRAGIVQEPQQHLKALRRVARWGLAFAIAFSVAEMMLRPRQGQLSPLGRVLVEVMGSFGPAIVVLQALAYGAWVVLLHERVRVRPWLATIAAAGRMALTCYLLQSLICGLLFYGYGLGLYDRVSPGVGMLMVVAIYVAEVAFCNAWLRRYRFGPVEWVWRSLTYRQAQTML
ncbi:DUF418 domain-containing protein [Chondromyces apiculatus]|uniref:DUF418 domain-containing protein n=1 Tax=Chondromyces apiculatus DSM 436 TaxID=1192034 RepID=A0A017T7J3_9BACT|nr:DUF418 domain-containing protein [Chondromyces apiculatus]EYF04780.1 Hypothetical protein CAP_4256 [Chondromyces apiculatus DSM 436]